ncbi:MAG: cobalamin B12-binding domain-containing protein [Elusimicrobia bacterium]|nr:cobalamin B12-binding domain-containing protein [Elusimicrobiota bacterium]
MKILLIKAARLKSSPSRRHDGVMPPLGLLYLSAALKKAGYSDVTLLHIALEGLDAAGVEREIARQRPDVVGISAMTSEAVSMHETAAAARKAGVPLVVAGGAHPTGYTAECLADANIDAVVRNEGELTFPELLAAHERGEGFGGVKGVSWRRGGELVDNPQREFIEDLDSLPLPDWDLADPGRYTAFVPHSPMLYGRRYMSVFTSRGCPFRCTYCHNVFGKRFRAHSPARVLLELKLLKEKYGVTDIEIADDVFNLDRARAAAVMRGLITGGYGLGLFFGNGLRAELLDEELVALFALAGVRYVSAAVETASPRLREKIKKNADLGKLRAAVELLAKKRIFVNAFVMMGFPGETLREMLVTARYLWSLPAHSFLLFFCRGYAGAELCAQLPPAKRIDPKTDNTCFVPYGGCADQPAWLLLAVKQLTTAVFYFGNPGRLWRIFRDLPFGGPRLYWFLFRTMTLKFLTPGRR